MSFDESWECNQIRTNITLFRLLRHVIEYFRRFDHVTTADTTVNDRIVCYDIGLHVIRAKPHLFIYLDGLQKFESSRVCFYHGCVNNGIRLDPHPALFRLKNLLESSLSFLDTVVFHASINQTSKGNIVVFISCKMILKHLKCLVELTLLAISLDQNSHLNRFVLACICWILICTFSLLRNG